MDIFFRKNNRKLDFKKIRSVGGEVFLADKRTDVAKLTVAFRSFSKTPKNTAEDHRIFWFTQQWNVKHIKHNETQTRGDNVHAPSSDAHSSDAPSSDAPSSEHLAAMHIAPMHLAPMHIAPMHLAPKRHFARSFIILKILFSLKLSTFRAVNNFTTSIPKAAWY